LVGAVERHAGGTQHAVTVSAVNAALDCGYVAIDTAQRYGTEPAIGEVLAERFAQAPAGPRWRAREDVFITTKVANPRPAPAGMLPGGGLKYMLQSQLSAYDGVMDEFDGCLKNLQLDAVDLLLIHFPGVRATRSSTRRHTIHCPSSRQH
jgi:diketogulonate reductase-like aldo/keto reductase